MIITKLQGGLGNQFFQYAFGRSLATKNNDQLKLDITHYKKNNFRNYNLKLFNIKADIATKDDLQEYNNYRCKRWKKIFNRHITYHKRKIIYQKYRTVDNNLLNLKNNVYLEGNWQSEKYFIEYKDIIKNELTLKNEFTSNISPLIEKLKKLESVSVHIRRGDYKSDKSNVYHILDINYYKKAIKRLQGKVKNPIFYIFSDNIAWCRKNLNYIKSPRFISGSGFKDFEDLILMSHCQHNIIANSSFSWWGAWLNNNSKKLVVAPKKWFIDKARYSPDLLPSRWIKI